MLYSRPADCGTHILRVTHGRHDRATQTGFKMNGIPGLLLLGALAALANLVGGLLLASSGAYRHESKLLKYLVALGAGFMLAAIFIEIVPETVALWTSNARGASAEAVVGAFTLLLGGYLLIQL